MVGFSFGLSQVLSQDETTESFLLHSQTVELESKQDAELTQA